MKGEEKNMKEYISKKFKIILRLVSLCMLCILGILVFNTPSYAGLFKKKKPPLKVDSWTLQDYKIWADNNIGKTTKEDIQNKIATKGFEDLSGILKIETDSSIQFFVLFDGNDKKSLVKTAAYFFRYGFTEINKIKESFGEPIKKYNYANQVFYVFDKNGVLIVNEKVVAFLFGSAENLENIGENMGDAGMPYLKEIKYSSPNEPLIANINMLVVNFSIKTDKVKLEQKEVEKNIYSWMTLFCKCKNCIKFENKLKKVTGTPTGWESGYLRVDTEISYDERKQRFYISSVGKIEAKTPYGIIESNGREGDYYSPASQSPLFAEQESGEITKKFHLVITKAIINTCENMKYRVEGGGLERQWLDQKLEQELQKQILNIADFLVTIFVPSESSPYGQESYNKDNLVIRLMTEYIGIMKSQMKKIIPILIEGSKEREKRWKDIKDAMESKGLKFEDLKDTYVAELYRTNHKIINSIMKILIATQEEKAQEIFALITANEMKAWFEMEMKDNKFKRVVAYPLEIINPRLKILEQYGIKIPKDTVEIMTSNIAKIPDEFQPSASNSDEIRKIAETNVTCLFEIQEQIKESILSEFKNN